MQDLFHMKLCTKSFQISYSLGVITYYSRILIRFLSRSGLHFKAISLEMLTSFIAADVSS